MDTLLLPADHPEAVTQAVARLTAGEPVALPTETVYGLAADATNPTAVARVFEAKERPFFDPLIVHLPPEPPEPGAGGGDRWLERIAAPLPSPAARETVARLAARFWPGPLTILLPRRPETVPDLVTAGSPRVAVRRSAHPVFAAVAAAFGRPLAAPSANRFGRVSPTAGQHVWSELNGRIPLILDAGPTTHGLESTVVAPRDDGGLHVLRPGPVTAEMLAEIAPVVRPTASDTHVLASVVSAPGQTASHYAPRTPLALAGEKLPQHAGGRGGDRRRRLGALVFRPDVAHHHLEDATVRPPREARGGETARFVRTEFLSAAGDLREAAANLFAALRRLDEAGLDLIVAEQVPEVGLGVAINERLRRAAAKR